MKNIDQTLEYYKQLASRDGGFPGALLALRAEPLVSLPTGLGLPKGYVEFIQRHHVEDVSLGALELTPLPAKNIYEALRFVNGKYKSLYVSENYVHVANYEGDLVLLAKGDDMHGDCRVYFSDISTGFCSEPICLADNFVDFIVTAANLDRSGLEGNEFLTVTCTDFVRQINPTLSETGLRCWEQIWDMYS